MSTASPSVAKPSNLPFGWNPSPTVQSTAPVPAQTCSCAKTVALSVQRGATLSTKISLSVTDSTVDPPVKNPVDLTGAWFQFTAKPPQDPPLADIDPATIMIDWQESTTSLQGYTWLVIPAETTYDMQDIAYDIQVRMVSASNVVTPLVGGTLTVTEPPASARYETS